MTDYVSPKTLLGDWLRAGDKEWQRIVPVLSVRFLIASLGVSLMHRQW